MKPLKYISSNATAKAGINYLNVLTANCNCIFQEIDTKNDLGVDAIIEIIKDERPTNKVFAVQVKSGSTFYNFKKKMCSIPVKKHFSYWKNYHMPLYGIVFVPALSVAYWVDIKAYLSLNPSCQTISFPATRVNVLNNETFKELFISRFTNEIPNISFEFAADLFSSTVPMEFELGMFVLFKKYGDKTATWDLIVNYFLSQNISKIPNQLISYIAYCPWHPDKFFYKDSFTAFSQSYGKSLINKFTKVDVIKLLTFIDPHIGIQRGTLGQDVEAIISAVANKEMVLMSIIGDKEIPLRIREFAAMILAYYNGLAAVPALQILVSEGSEDILMVIDFMEHFQQPYEFYV